MVNTVALQLLEDGHRDLVLKLNVQGDGSGEETATMFVDISTYATDQYGVAASQFRILTVTASLFTFDMALLWDADTDLFACAVPSGGQVLDYRPYGGLKNNAGTGKTGDLRFTTVGLGANDYGTVVLEMRKIR